MPEKTYNDGLQDLGERIAPQLRRLAEEILHSVRVIEETSRILREDNERAEQRGRQYVEDLIKLRC